MRAVFDKRRVERPEKRERQKARRQKAERFAAFA